MKTTKKWLTWIAVISGTGGLISLAGIFYSWFVIEVLAAFINILA